MKDKKKQKPYLIGITGSLGTGKSLIGNILSKLGVFVIDTDDVVRDLLKTKNQISQKIASKFGEAVLNKNPNEYTNKKILSDIVFTNVKKRKILESIVHPEVRKRLARLIAGNKNKKIITVLVPLLFETHMENLFNETWCVICSKKIQLLRLKRKGYTLKEAIARIKAQLPQKEKIKRADFNIDNSYEINKTKLQVVNRLKALAQSDRNRHLSFCK